MPGVLLVAVEPVFIAVKLALFAPEPFMNSEFVPASYLKSALSCASTPPAPTNKIACAVPPLTIPPICIDLAKPPYRMRS